MAMAEGVKKGYDALSHPVFELHVSKKEMEYIKKKNFKSWEDACKDAQTRLKISCEDVSFNLSDRYSLVPVFYTNENTKKSTRIYSQNIQQQNKVQVIPQIAKYLNGLMEADDINRFVDNITNMATTLRQNNNNGIIFVKEISPHEFRSLPPEEKIFASYSRFTNGKVFFYKASIAYPKCENESVSENQSLSDKSSELKTFRNSFSRYPTFLGSVIDNQQSGTASKKKLETFCSPGSGQKLDKNITKKIGSKGLSIS